MMRSESFLLVGFTFFVLAIQPAGAEPKLNPALLKLEPDRWVKIHEHVNPPTITVCQALRNC